MLTLQDELITITARPLKESDDLHNGQQPPNVTQFGVATFVLVQQRTTPETRMHTLWRGPMRVVSHNFAEYTLLDLVTHKKKLYHMTQLKPFHFDPAHVDPTDIAGRDYLEFFTEDILDMKGNIRAYKSLTLYVKWLNYTHEHNTWEPWTQMRKSQKVHEFLIKKNLKHLIPREYIANYC